MQVSGLTVSTRSPNAYDSVAVKTDGTVWAWGRNDLGQLGDGTTTERTTPVQVSGVTGVDAVGAGDSHTVALKSDGTVWAWGEPDGRNRRQHDHRPQDPRAGALSLPT